MNYVVYKFAEGDILRVLLVGRDDVLLALYLVCPACFDASHLDLGTPHQLDYTSIVPPSYLLNL